MRLGNIELKWLGHSSFFIRAESKIIYIDPYQINAREKADIILLTHPHYDHCSVQDIGKIAKDGTIIAGPAGIQSKIAKLDKKIEMKIMDVGETFDLGIKVGAVPAYNIGKEFHRKDESWLGYTIQIGNTTIYHAGDTDLIPEMSKLAGKVTIALLPVGGEFTMDAEEAAEAASLIKPSFAVPMHYGSGIGEANSGEKFVNLCKEKGINSEVLQKE